MCFAFLVLIGFDFSFVFSFAFLIRLPAIGRAITMIFSTWARRTLDNKNNESCLGAFDWKFIDMAAGEIKINPSLTTKRRFAVVRDDSHKFTHIIAPGGKRSINI